MASHRSQTPEVVERYFRAVCPESLSIHGVTIGAYFVPEKGWRRVGGRQVASGNKVRKLRAQGATSVAFACGAREADFTMKELLGLKAGA